MTRPIIGPTDLERAYEAGATIRDLAFRYGVGRARIISALRATGRYHPRRRSRPWQRRREADCAAAS